MINDRRRSKLNSTRRGLLGGAALLGSTITLFGRAVEEPLAQEPQYERGARFSSLGPQVNGLVAIEPEGSDGIRTWSATSDWSERPAMRLRVSRPERDASGGQHLLIGPYEYGMAIEYNGVVECWVNEWSIHSNHEGGDPDPARFWVGNHDDTGGVMITAVRRDGSAYGEVVSQLFSRTSGGDLRFVVRNSGDAWEFRAGPEGVERPVLRLSGEGQLSLETSSVNNPALEIRRAAGPQSEVVFNVDADGTARISPVADSAAMEVGPPGAPPVLRLTGNGQVYARFNKPEQVWIGASGPRNEAGIAFGREGDVRLYRARAGELRLNGRLITDAGFGVAGAEVAYTLGAISHRVPLHDEAGDLLGYLPVHRA